jgi:S1-C subfamily serine protease
VPGLSGRPVTISSQPATVGDPVTSLGYADGGPLRTIAGSVTDRGQFQVSDIWFADYSPRELLATNLAVRGGDSGGPVLDAKQEVVGVVFAGSARRRHAEAFADDVTELTQFLAARPAPVGTDRCADDRVDIQ